MCKSSYHLGSLASYRDLIRAEVAADAEEWRRSAPAPSFPDIHIASACLQKALRRGNRDFAFASARTLLERDEPRLWRRLTVCAFEDFGLVDVALTARVVAASASKTFRVGIGEERVLAFLIRRLCETPKDRRLDDLSALADWVLGDSQRLRSIENAPLGEVLAPLVHQATRLVASCEQEVAGRGFRRLSGEASERALARMAREGLIDQGLHWLCLSGIKTSRCRLPLLLPLAIEATEECGGLGEPHELPMPAAPLVGGIPAYAFDGFTRMGRAILAQLGAGEPRLVAVLRQVSPRERLDVLHHLLFFAEGSCSTPLVSDPLSEALTDQAIACGTRLSHPEAQKAVALMSELLPILHAMRVVALRGQAREMSG